jgi:hypothetical protein
MADLLGEDLGLAEIHKLYRCHDRLLEHKQALFDHLVRRGRDLFNISLDGLLYDLTSTYFEADPPFAESDKRRHGHSRYHRPDCVQVVIAFPAYCRHATLARRRHALAPGLSPRSVIEKFAAMQMIDVHVSRPPTAANCGSPDIPNPMPSSAYCSISSNSRCQRSRHPKSPPRRLLRNPRRSEDL